MITVQSLYKLIIYIWSKFSKLLKLCSIYIFHESAISISNWQRAFFLFVRFITRLYFDLHIITDYWNPCTCRIYIHRRIVSKFQNFTSFTVLMNQRFQLRMNNDLFFNSSFYHFIILSFHYFIILSSHHFIILFFHHLIIWSFHYFIILSFYHLIISSFHLLLTSFFEQKCCSQSKQMSE